MTLHAAPDNLQVLYAQGYLDLHVLFTTQHPAPLRYFDLAVAYTWYTTTIIIAAVGQYYYDNSRHH